MNQVIKMKGDVKEALAHGGILRRYKHFGFDPSRAVWITSFLHEWHIWMVDAEFWNPDQDNI